MSQERCDSRHRRHLGAASTLRPDRKMEGGNDMRHQGKWSRPLAVLLILVALPWWLLLTTVSYAGIVECDHQTEICLTD